MKIITLEEFRDAIQESTAPLVDGRLIPIVDGQALEIESGDCYTGTPITFWLWSKDDFDEYKEELKAARGITEGGAT
jgi:hypothetical protein